MTQLEKYSLHLPYDIKGIVYYPNVFPGEKISLSIKGGINGQCDIYEWCDNTYITKPYLRPLNHLKKLISQKNYNEGKPFVPLSELERMRGIYQKDFPIEETYKDLIKDLVSHTNLNIRVPFDYINQLIKWHFCIGFEEGEYIEVTKENNPY